MQTTIEVFAFLKDRLCAAPPICPTLREVAAWVGLAHRASVIRHLDRLEQWGLIRREPHTARGIWLTVKSKQTSASDLQAQIDDDPQ